MAVPSTATILSSTAKGSNAILLAYSAGGATSFKILFSKDNINFKQILTRTGFFALVIELLPSTTYYFKVIGSNLEGDGPESSVASATTLAQANRYLYMQHLGEAEFDENFYKASEADAVAYDYSSYAFWTNGKVSFASADTFFVVDIVTNTHTITATQDVIIGNKTTAFTITLPTAVGVTGKNYHIKNTGIGVITLEGDGSETIDSELNQTINQFESIHVVSDGTGWWIL